MILSLGDPLSSFALQVQVWLNGAPVDDRLVAAGERVQIGNAPGVQVPVPAGAPFVARGVWAGPDVVRVQDGRGQAWVVGRGQPLRMELGGVAVEMKVVAQHAHRRAGWFTVAGSLPWLAMVMGSSLFASQSEIIVRNRCEWFAYNMTIYAALQCPPPKEDPNQQANNGADGAQKELSAEYIQRLLAQDYEGEETGSTRTEAEEQFEKKTEKRLYMPAGAEGPATAMGGAENTAPVPVRAPKRESVPLETEKAAPEEPLVKVPDAKPIPDAAKPNEAEKVERGIDDDAVADGDLDGAREPAEEKQGWGIPDWYDESDAKMENVEIQLMLSYAKRRLKIDPNDLDALSVMSYYQYLAEDYDQAGKTYDRYIDLAPDSSAGYNNKALVFKRRGEYRTEESLYRQALALAPDDVTALNNLAVCLAHQKRYEEALAVMRQLEILDPGDPYADLHRAKIHADMGKDDDALMFLNRALAGMAELDILHAIEFRQDIRVDPSFEKLRHDQRFHEILVKYYGKDAPLEE